MTLHPYATVIDGRLETGLKLTLNDQGVIEEITTSDRQGDHYVLCTAFVNAHSHLEYRGLQDSIKNQNYFDWLGEITRAKTAQKLENVREDCLIAALENRKTGVAYIAEHSDRPFSGEAMSAYGLDGRIYQEVITLFENKDPSEKLASVAESLRKNVEAGGYETVLSAHAPWTVDVTTLTALARVGDPLSIHVAESVHENEYFRQGKGPIAELCKRAGMEHPVGASVVQFLSSIGCVRPGVQFVHACDLNSSDIETIAQGNVTVAHCPRSNEALNCPRAPIRELLDAGIQVGLGLDSAASSGKIDMFAEMRSALSVAESRGKPLTPEEVWRMATSMGAASVQADDPWDIIEGASVHLLKVHIENARTIKDLIEIGEPRSVEWVMTDVRN